MPLVSIFGSYNGQPNLGDKCLLLSVLSSFDHYFQNRCRYICHFDTSSPKSQRWWHELSELRNVEVIPSLNAFLLLWSTKLRHLPVPFVVRQFIAFVTFPLFLVLATDARKAFGIAVRALQRSDIVYCYGGTSLSGQWFWGNIYYYLLVGLICRVSGRSFYMGPQQYGPQNRIQNKITQWFLKHLVTDYRARHEACKELLGASEANLTFDEVFGCTSLYPISQRSSRNRDLLLVNLRANAFSRTVSEAERIAFAKVVEELSRSLRGARVVVFQMSDAAVCDDAGVMEYFRTHCPGLDVSLAPRFTDEHELIRLCGEAFGVISMSYHGCVFAMLAGVPAVPVVIGGYYDYKFRDFARYCGGQQWPVLDLSLIDPGEGARSVRQYFEEYDNGAVVRTRVEAERQRQTWYRSFAVDGALENRSLEQYELPPLR
jgi:polysaccharide pyruvyl transferase WcaK-like protein